MAMALQRPLPQLHGGLDDVGSAYNSDHVEVLVHDGEAANVLLDQKAGEKFIWQGKGQHDISRWLYCLLATCPMDNAPLK